MKYFSELLNKPFDTEKECLDAEAKYQQSKDAVSKRKKELSKAIEDADNKITEANKAYDIAREKAKDILEKTNKEITELLDKAEKAVTDAEQEKLDAVKAFTKEFGTYKVNLTGEKSVDAFNRSLNRFNNFFKSFSNWF